MKSLLLSILLTGYVCLATYSQSKIPQNPNKTDAKGLRQGKWTHTFDKDWTPVTDKAKIVYYRVVTYKDNVPQGKVNDFYLSGKKQFEGTLLADQPADAIEGIAYWYYENGVKKEEVQYEKGVRNGKYILYNEKGSKIQESTYKNDFETDIQFFSPNGTVRQPNKWVEINKQGDLYFSNAKYDLALTSFKKGLKQAEIEFGKKHVNYASALGNLGAGYQMTKDMVQAETLLKQSQDLYRELVGEKHADYVSALKALAYFYWDTEEFDKTAELYDKALQIRLELYGDKHKLYAESLDNLGVTYLQMGLYKKAEPLLKKSVQLSKEAIGEKAYNYGIALHNLASCLKLIGDYGQARELFKQTLDVFKANIGDKHPNYATVLVNMASVSDLRGNYQESKELYEQALQIRKQVFGEKHTAYANSLGDIGYVCMKLKEFSKAETYLKQSLALYSEKADGKNTAGYANILRGIGLLYFRQNDFEKTEGYLQQSLEVYKKVLGENHSVTSFVLTDIGNNYTCLKKYEEAEDAYKKSLAIKKETADEANQDYGIILNNISFVYKAKGNFEKAEETLNQAVAILQQNLDKNFFGMNESEKEKYWKSGSFLLTSYRSFCLDYYKKKKKIETTLGNWYNLETLSKGILLESTEKVKKRILSSNNPALIASFNKWEDFRQQVAKLRTLPLAEQKKKKVTPEQLQKQADNLEIQLSVQSEAFKNAYNPPKVSWQEIQKKLKPKEAAIEIIRIYINQALVKDTLYAALIITPKTKKGPELVVFSEGDNMETDAYRTYRRNIITRKQDSISYITYWKSIQDKLKAAKITKVYLSPDGVYNQLNINTLQNPATKKYVIDEIDIQLVNNTKELVLTKAASKTSEKTGKLFGHPNYLIEKEKYKTYTAQITRSRDLNDFTGDFTNVAYSELPGTRTEVIKIDSLLRLNSWKTESFLGEKATEENVKAVLNPTVLHVATHGFFNSTSNENLDAMLRSGIVLAGVQNYFQSQVRPNTDDGILSAYEAMNMDLDDTELVVLSACETGLGKVENGEGVYGLGRAFRVAGAKSLLMSLWKVDDEATQKLMNEFYSIWLKTGNKRESFRQAQQGLKSRYNHPYFWGAFVMVGD